MAYRGKFKPRNLKKYKGDPNKVTYRSLWELKFMKSCDNDPTVIAWNSEEIIIPYRCETDMEMHRYFTDFWVKRSKPNKAGITEFLIEVKPHQQTQDPNPNGKKRKTKRMLTEMKTYAKNKSKWKAAKRYCDKRGWQFVIMTEYGLGIKKRK